MAQNEQVQNEYTCPPRMNCAHELSIAFAPYFPELGWEKKDQGFLRRPTTVTMKNGYARCLCGSVIRAKEMREWAIKTGFQELKQKLEYPEIDKIYLIYEQNKSGFQGHVWGIINNIKCGNGNYDWENKAYSETYWKMKPNP